MFLSWRKCIRQTVWRKSQNPARQIYATSSNTSGCLAAIFSSTLAGPAGVRRPCSQFWSVSALMPKTAANFDCDNPSLPRTFTMSFFGSILKTRDGFNSPRLICPASRRLCFNCSKSSLFMILIMRHWRILSTLILRRQRGMRSPRSNPQKARELPLQGGFELGIGVGFEREPIVSGVEALSIRSAKPQFDRQPSFTDVRVLL